MEIEMARATSKDIDVRIEKMKQERDKLYLKEIEGELQKFKEVLGKYGITTIEELEIKLGK